jgi:hypothetical protein
VHPEGDATPAAPIATVKFDRPDFIRLRYDQTAEDRILRL